MSTLDKKLKKPVKNSSPEVKKGAPDTKAIAVNPISEGKTRIGIAKGCTINMGSYESARVEVWMERVVDDDEHSINKAINDIGELLDDYIATEVSELKGE